MVKPAATPAHAIDSTTLYIVQTFLSRSMRSTFKGDNINPQAAHDSRGTVLQKLLVACVFGHPLSSCDRHPHRNLPLHPYLAWSRLRRSAGLVWLADWSFLQDLRGTTDAQGESAPHHGWWPISKRRLKLKRNHQTFYFVYRLWCQIWVGKVF